jgi:hypothetical protein
MGCARSAFLSDVDGTIGVNTSEIFALADGLTSCEHRALAMAWTGIILNRRKTSPSAGWRPASRGGPPDGRSLSDRHGFLRRALSREVIVPGVTTTQDVAWWLTQTAHDSGHGIWFHPGVTVQRRGADASSPPTVSRIAPSMAGDMVHIDFGIVRHGYHTDQQQHAYVLAEGEVQAPSSFVRGLSEANRLQDI